MAISGDDIETLAARIEEAYGRTGYCDPPSSTHELDLDDAYNVQDAVIERRCSAIGTERVGFKIGFTNEAIRNQRGIDRPIYGQILDSAVQQEPMVQRTHSEDLRIEPELAFRLGERLEPPIGPAGVVAATQAVFPTIELIHGRVGEPPEITDHVADNALHAGVVVGDTVADPRTVADGDLSMAPVQVRVNGSFHEAGLGANAMGNPARAVAWLAERRAERGDPLSAGDVILTGSLTQLIDVDPGDVVECRWGRLGSVSLRVE